MIIESARETAGAEARRVSGYDGRYIRMRDPARKCKIAGKCKDAGCEINNLVSHFKIYFLSKAELFMITEGLIDSCISFVKNFAFIYILYIL